MAARNAARVVRFRLLRPASVKTDDTGRSSTVTTVADSVMPSSAAAAAALKVDRFTAGKVTWLALTAYGGGGLGGEGEGGNGGAVGGAGGMMRLLGLGGEGVGGLFKGVGKGGLG